MQNIREIRKPSSEEATAAREWAHWLELKHAVLCGFTANANTEGVRLIRAWEPENADLATHMESAWHLVKTVTVLQRKKNA